VRSDRFFWSAYIVAIAVIGSNDKFVIIFAAESNYFSDNFIELFNCFDDSIHFSGMTYHISVGEIYYDEVEVFGFMDELIVNLLCRHLRIKIISRYFMRRNENIFLTIKYYLFVAIKEFGDVSKFFRFREVKLTKLLT
jgi:hypothetical protein